MMAFSLVLATIFTVAGLCAGQQQPECAKEFSSFHDCMRNNSKPPPPPSQHDFDDVNGCFTKSDCSPPQFGPPPQNGPGGRAGPPPNGGQGAPPPGGHGGPPPFASDDASQKCFRSVHESVHDQFATCMKKKDPDFDKNGPPPPPGPPPGGFGPPPPGGSPFGGPPPPGGPPFGGPPPFGGGGPPPGGPPPGGPPPFGGGPPPGGPPHGFGGPPPGDGPPVEVLANLCNGDEKKAKQLKQCFDDLREKHKPSKDQIKQAYDSQCDAEKKCKPLLGKCDDIMKKKGQAHCECHQEMESKLDEAFKNEKSCADVKKPPPPPGDKPDCSKPPPNMCDEGFDKFYENFSKGGPPPPPPPPPPAKSSN